MKTLLSIALGVSLCCLLASNGMAADEAKPALFTIVSAQYGAGDQWSDVSDKVKAAVQNDALIIAPANSNFGAPIGGTKKTLKVVVKYNGREFAFQADEGATLTINKAVLDAKVGGSVPVAGAVLWIDASTLSAGSYDASTTPVSNLGTQGGTFSAGPYSVNATGINGKAALEFDGTDDYLQSTDAYANGGTTLTMFVVEKRITEQGEWFDAWKGSVSCTDGAVKDNESALAFALIQDDQNPRNLLIVRAMNGKASIAHPGVGAPFISTVVFDNGNCTHYLKTSSGSSSASSGSAEGNFGITSTVLGARQRPGPTEAFANINIGEVLIYNSALSVADQEAVESYLAAKWGIGTGIGRPKQGGALNTRRDPPAALAQTGDPAKEITEKPAKDAAAQTGDPAKDILQLTGGARTKIVWTRVTPETIMLFDTNVGSEQVVMQGPFGWPQVFITPTGTRIIFMKNTTSLYVVDTSGANERELCAAKSALGVAEDPPGTEWAYYGDAYHDVNPQGRLWRVQIDNPKVKQLIWDKTNIGWQWAFTRDGRTAAAALPWPGCHIANLPNVSYYPVHDSGCMVGLAPSATRMLHATALQFGGEHRGISVHVIPGGSDTEINLGTAPGCWEKTMQHPNWAMYDDRFFVVSGPWTGTSGTTHVLFGQFNAAFNGIASWVQVTQAPAGKQDIYSKCWIQSGPDVKASPQVDPIKTKAAEDREPAPTAGGWPADRTDLIFLWENRKGAFLAYDREGKAIPSLILMPRDRARFDHNQGLWLEAGAFHLPEEVKLLQAQKPAALTLEAYLTPGQANGASLAEIISFSASSDDANFVLGQLGNKLVMTMKGGAKPAELCTLTAGEPVHVIVTYAPGKLTCYKNGKPAGVVDNFQGSPANWTEQHLVFGNNWDGKRPWAGHLEGIAIYTRALGPQEAEQEHAAFAKKLKSRKPVPRIEIRARLLAKTKPPTFEDIAPYTQATTVYEYEVEKVVSGQCKEKKIRVAHHTLIDRKMLPASRAEIGKSYTLELEPIEANPQLDIDAPRDDLPLDLDVVRYYDVGPLGKTP